MEILTLAAPLFIAGYELKAEIAMALVLYFMFLEGLWLSRDRTLTKKTRNKKTREGIKRHTACLFKYF